MDVVLIETVLDLAEKLSSEEGRGGILDKVKEEGTFDEKAILSCCLERGLFVDVDYIAAYNLFKDLVVEMPDALECFYRNQPV